jgi:hypothetical protein
MTTGLRSLHLANWGPAQVLASAHDSSPVLGKGDANDYPRITYYWTVPLILDHSYLVGKLTSSKNAYTKVSEF